MDESGGWVAGFVLTAVAVAAGVIIAGYVGGYLQAKSGSSG